MSRAKWLRVCGELAAALEALRAELVRFEAAWSEARRASESVRYLFEAQDLQRRTERAQQTLRQHLEHGYNQSTLVGVPLDGV